jgi:CDP-4-dehydro-6-deoxyglucose reductase, E1
MYKITYGGMLFGDEEREAVNRVLDRNYWPLAEEGDAMEKESANYLGIKYGILANSGSSAGLLALSALELPQGSEVIIPATTFPTIFNIILQCNLTPVVVDTTVGTYNLDVEDVRAAITNKTGAIIAVHAVGNPCDMPALATLAEEKGIYLIEDNCDGFGGSIDGKKLGTFGDVSFTSFHAAHIVSMGQGGGVFTDNETIAQNARMYRDWGRQANVEPRKNTEYPALPEDYNPRFIYEKIGYNLSPLELQAAMGRVQLTRVEYIKAKRKANFDYLYEHLSRYDELIMPKWAGEPSWFAFPLSVKGNRGALVDHLEKNGIETRSLFAGNITRHPAYKNSNYRVSGTLEEADYITEHSFWVGVHPRMTQEDREFMVKTFDDYFNA